MSKYFCSAEWHLRRYMGGHITLAALLYPFALAISKNTARFFCSGIELADYFNCSQTTVYANIQLLEDLGFFEYLQTFADRRKVYAVLTHSQWAKSHPGRCVVKDQA